MMLRYSPFSIRPICPDSKGGDNVREPGKGRGNREIFR